MTRQEDRIVRGAPRFVVGPAAGDRGVVALVPEARVASRRSRPGGNVETEVMPVALLELRPDGITRHELKNTDQAMVRWVGVLGLVIAGVCFLARIVAPTERRVG